jgi:Protein of unknown function (DUF1566)
MRIPIAISPPSRRLLVACALFCAPFCQGAELLLRTAIECSVSVDGKALGTLKPSTDTRLTLPPGAHQIEALSLGGAVRWQKTIQLAAAEGPQVIDIPLQTAALSLQAANGSYWIDPATQTMWTAADNGSGVSLRQAARYCRLLHLGGFNDWTLPSIDDLQQILGDRENQGGYHIKGSIKLTGWQWSATPGTQEGEGWALDFGDGGRASVAAGDSGLNRALCIRHASK